MSRLMEMAREADTIAILGHTRPDGDCVRSEEHTSELQSQR